MWSASGSGERGGTRKPFTPCSTSSGTPETAVDTTGICIDMASTRTFGSASVTSGTGTVRSKNIDTNDAHNYIVNLTGVTNAQVLKVSLTNVSDSAGDFSPAVAGQMGVLIGDVNGSGVVTSGDTNLCKAQALQPVTSANFRNDVNASGSITTGDVNIIKQNALTHLP